MASRRDAIEAGRAFFRRLAAEGAFAPVFLLYGEERFLVDEAMQRIERSVFPDKRDDFNYVRYHASETKAEDVVAAAQMVPMFAARRVVVCRGLERYDKKAYEAIAAYAGFAESDHGPSAGSAADRRPNCGGKEAQEGV